MLLRPAWRTVKTRREGRVSRVSWTDLAVTIQEVNLLWPQGPLSLTHSYLLTSVKKERTFDMSSFWCLFCHLRPKGPNCHHHHQTKTHLCACKQMRKVCLSFSFTCTIGPTHVQSLHVSSYQLNNVLSLIKSFK